MTISELPPDHVLSALPIFPLPGVVFFPRTLLPLHVFEPRYMAMLRDLWEGERMLGIVQLAPGWESDYYGAPSVRPMLGVGEVVHLQEVEGEDRAHILVRGIGRGQILEEHHTDLMYRTVRAAMVGSHVDDEAGAARGVAAVRQLFARLLTGVEGADLDQAEVLFRPDADVSVVLDAIAASLPLTADAKQQLLEELEIEARADRLAQSIVDLSYDAGELPGAP